VIWTNQLQLSPINFNQKRDSKLNLSLQTPLELLYQYRKVSYK